MFDAGHGEGQLCNVTAPGAGRIGGGLFCAGSHWIRPDFRGHRLSHLLSRLGRAYAMSCWPVDWAIALVAPVLIEKGVSAGYGYKHASRSIFYPPHPGATSRSSPPICPRTKLIRTLPNTSPRNFPARSPLVWRRRPSAHPGCQGYIPKIPLISLPCLMHLGIARLLGIFGQGRCIHYPRLHQTASTIVPLAIFSPLAARCRCACSNSGH